MSTSTTRYLLATLNVVGLVGVLVANSLANALPLNGRTTGEISERFPNLFVPAGLTFSIWGLIYLWLIAFCVYGFIGGDDSDSARAVRRIGPWFLVSCVANAAWIVAWHWLLVPLSLGIMLVLLGALVTIYLRLGIGRGQVGMDRRWLAHAPFSIYLGWITVATVASVTTVAVDLGAPAFGALPAALTVVVLTAVTGITAAVLWTRRDLLYGAVIIWALLGIVLERWAASAEGSSLVAGAALVAGVVVVGQGLVVGLRSVAARPVEKSSV